MEEVVAHLFSLIFHLFHPSEADYLVSEQSSFHGVRLLVSRPTPNLEDQGILLRLAPTPWPVRMGDPTSSYATASIALRGSGAHHDKVATPSVGLRSSLLLEIWYTSIHTYIYYKNTVFIAASQVAGWTIGFGHEGSSSDHVHCCIVL
jgi:hypothetical protein